MHWKIRIVTLAVTLISVTAFAATKTFKDTKEYRKEQHGYLNEKFDTYSKMIEEPKGTICDWVYVVQEYNLEELRGCNVTFFAAPVIQDGALGSLFGNPIVSAFESNLQSIGLQLMRQDQQQGHSMDAYHAAMEARKRQYQADHDAAVANAFRTNPQVLEMTIDSRMAAQSQGVEGQMELDLYNQEKEKLGLEEAMKRATERKAKKRNAIRAEILGEIPITPTTPTTPALPATPAVTEVTPTSAPTPAEPSRPKRPEEFPGFVLVCYVTEAKSNDSAAFWTGIATNTTTAEFILLKDGKPVLAGRHNSASIGFGGGSGAKCGNALASAFRVIKQSPKSP